MGQVVGSARNVARRMRALDGVMVTAILKAAGQIAMGLIMIRGQAMALSMPFGAVLMAAGIAHGWSFPLMMLGGILGAILPGAMGETLGFSAPIIAMFVSGAAIEISRIRVIKERVRIPAFAICAVSWLGSGVWFLSGAPMDFIALWVTTAIAACALPYFDTALSVRSIQAARYRENRIAIAVTAACALTGVANLHFFGCPLDWAVCLAVTYMLAAAMGAPGGCLAGMCAGLAMTLAGSDPELIYIACVCGGLSGAIKKKYAWAYGGVGMVICALFAMSWGWDFGGFILRGAAIAAVITLCIPERVRKMLYLSLSKEAAVLPAMPGRSARFQREAAQQISAIADAFSTLSEDMGESKDDIALIKDEICYGCANEDSCWKSGAGGWFFDMLYRAQKHPLNRSEVPLEFVARCSRNNAADMPICDAIDDFVGRKPLRDCESAADRLLFAQYTHTAEILSDAARRVAEPWHSSDKLSHAVFSALKKQGYPVISAMVYFRPDLLVDVFMDEAAFVNADGVKLSTCLANALSISGGIMPAIGEWHRAGERLFVREPAFGIESACAQHAREAICGDAWHEKRLRDGRFACALSDGMGCGERAHAVSNEAAQLIMLFLGVGYPEKWVLNTVNKLMISRRKGATFTTMDLLTIDLNSGEAVINKLGASPSFLYSHGVCRILTGNALPMGIVEEARAASEDFAVTCGDIIILTTDGVCDGSDPEATKALSDAVCQYACMGVKELVHALITLAPQKHNRDDATVYAIRVHGAGKY